MQRVTDSEPHKRAAQRALADDVTALVHGVNERESAAHAAAALFGRGDLADLPASTLEAVMGEVGAARVATLPSITEALTLAGLVDSKSAARRAIDEGGAYVNNTRITDPDLQLAPHHLLADRFVVLRRGRKTVGGLVLG